MSRVAVAAFLQHPAIAIRIGEAGEARIVAARGIESRRETSVPSADGRLVADRADRGAALKQLGARGIQVGNH
jgi:hypothetical protein